MSTKNLESVRECCTNPKSFLIIYDGADTGDLSVLVCDYCLVNKIIFQKFIKSKEPDPFNYLSKHIIKKEKIDSDLVTNGGKSNE